MKNISKVLAGLPLVLNGCGGGGSGDPGIGASSTLDISQYKGTWSNDQVQTVTTSSGNSISFGASVSLATSDDRLAFMTGDFKAIVVDPATSTGHYYSAFTYVDTVDISIAESNNQISLYFNNPDRGITGSIQVSRNNHYSRAATLAKLVGNWDDAYYSTYGAWSFQINADGSFTADSTIHFCHAEGNFSLIDSTANEYRVSMQVSNCSSNVTGTYNGIAYTSTTSTEDDTLIIMTTNGAGDSARFLGFKPEKTP